MGAFICANSVSISGYCRLYRMNKTSKLELLSHTNLHFQQQRLTLDHNSLPVVARTWMTSFKWISLHTPRVVDLLYLMVCLDNTKIPDSLLLSSIRQQEIPSS